jgi:hypothetical protein
MTKKELVTNINNAFKHVTLADGIGLWEAQGIDDYADSQTITALRKKDERVHWANIPFSDLVTCASSLSFFDAKGMRFCLPQFLLFDILADEIFENKNNDSPDVLFTLGYQLNEPYQESRFSLFNMQQVQVVIDFLDYKLEEMNVRKIKNSILDDGNKIRVFSADEYLEMNKTIDVWKKKLKAEN